MTQDTLYILAIPGETPRLAPRNCFPAWLAYRISPEMRLLRAEGPPNFRGGVMVVSGCAEEPRGDPERLCRALLGECAARGFRGLLLDLDRPAPALDRLARLLARELPRRGVTLFLPDGMADCVPGCRVLVSSALSGGSLEGRLKEAAEKYSSDRVVLAVERISEDFTLPAPTGCGRPLAPEELSRLLSDLRPHLHFSRPLCTRYFTYFRDDSFHLVLCDDGESFREKLACARRCGLRRFLLPWRDISAAPEEFLPK